MAGLTPGLSATDIIRLLELEPHPEGGHFRETFRHVSSGARDHSTAIFYLLAAGERSHWHRVDVPEVWHYYGGSPLRMSLSADGKSARHEILGLDLHAGERPQIVVPKDCWQAAESLGAWTLIGCTVAPAFEFSRFELAPADFDPA